MGKGHLWSQISSTIVNLELCSPSYITYTYIWYISSIFHDLPWITRITTRIFPKSHADPVPCVSRCSPARVAPPPPVASAAAWLAWLAWSPAGPWRAPHRSPWSSCDSFHVGSAVKHGQWLWRNGSDWLEVSTIYKAFILGPIFQVYVREYHHKMWPDIWYTSSILGSWSSHWHGEDLEQDMKHLQTSRNCLLGGWAYRSEKIWKPGLVRPTFSSKLSPGVQQSEKREKPRFAWGKYDTSIVLRKMSDLQIQ